MPQIADVMRPDFIEVAPEDTLGEVAERMTAKNVGAVVVKDFGTLIGILTERDLLKAMAARVHSSEARVRQWMTVDPVTATADTDVEEASRVMLEHGFRHLPVLDDDGQVTGVVSLRRVVGAASGSRRPGLGRARTRPIGAGSRAYRFSRTNATNSSAARVGARPDARTSEISRLAFMPSSARLCERARREVGFDGGARDERDAVARLHGAAHRLLEPELERRRRDRASERPSTAARPRPPGGRPRPPASRSSVSAPELVDPDRAARERVPGRADQDHLVLEDRLEAHRPVAPGGADDAELELAVGDEVDDRLGVVHLERDAQLGMTQLELAEEDGTATAAGPVEAPIDSSPVSAPAPSEATSSSICSSSCSRRWAPRKRRTPGLGRLHPAPGAVEQLRAEPLLERPHLERDGRLGDTEPLGRLGEAAPLDHGAERGKLARIHKSILSQDQRTSTV